MSDDRDHCPDCGDDSYAIALCDELRERAIREPLGVDISDMSDEWCAGYLAGQVNAFDALALANDGILPGYRRSGWDMGPTLAQTLSERDQARADAAEWKSQADTAWNDALAKVPSRTITFVTYDPETDGVAVKHDGEVVWQESSFDSLSQYFIHFPPDDVLIRIKVEP